MPDVKCLECRDTGFAIPSGLPCGFCNLNLGKATYKGRRGVTLIELLIVVAIILIMASIIVRVFK